MIIDILQIGRIFLWLMQIFYGNYDTAINFAKLILNDHSNLVNGERPAYEEILGLTYPSL